MIRTVGDLGDLNDFNEEISLPDTFSRAGEFRLPIRAKVILSLSKDDFCGLQVLAIALRQAHGDCSLVQIEECPAVNEEIRGTRMGKRVDIDTPAPEFALEDFQGQKVRLSDYRDNKHVVLIFNRGFI
jgi:hypothetical protein